MAQSSRSSSLRNPPWRDLSRRELSWPDLSGQRILVVEDEWVIAADLTRALRECCAEVVGPAPTLDRAMGLLAAERTLDGAVVDVNLRGLTAYPLADELERRGVRFVFATGYDAASIPRRYAHVPRCQKPLDAAAVAWALGCLVS